MILTTYNAATVALLNDEPDWSDAVRLEVTQPTRAVRGLTGREARRPVGDSLRLSLEWIATLETPALNALRDALQGIENAAVYCPAWPFAQRGSDWAGSSEVSAGLLIGWLSDWSGFEISAGLTPTDWDYVAPLLKGALAEWPNPEPLTPGVARVAFSFTEDADATFALVPDAVTFASGPALSDATVPYVFPFEIHWDAGRTSGGAAVEIERLRLADSRQSAGIYYPQSAERPQTATVLLTTGSEVAALLRWLADRHFGTEAHYVQTIPQATGLASTAAAGTNTLALPAGADLGSNRFLALSDGFTTEFVRVTNLTGDTATLSANLTHTWQPGSTMIYLVMLARHAGPKVSLTFRTPTVASAALAWRELPAEYTPAGVETRGTTLGALPLKSWLYKITLDWNGTTQRHNITSFEQDLSYGGFTFYSRPIEHGELRQNIALDRDELTLKTRWYSGSPFEKFLPNRLDCRVLLAIYECTVTGTTVSNVAQWFGGEITGLTQAEGPLLSLRAAGANALFDRRLLRMLLQPGCNDELFGPWCGLDRAAWEFTASVYAVSGKTITLETFSRTGGLPTGWGFAHYFALGYVQRTVSSLPVRQLVFDSAAKDGSNRVLITFGSPPDPAFAPGDSVSIWPGCDGRPATCQAYNAGTNPTGKFNNFSKFAGFPFLPDKDPAFQPLKKHTSSTGKK